MSAQGGGCLPGGGGCCLLGDVCPVGGICPGVVSAWSGEEVRLYPNMQWGRHPPREQND